jgi:hypothetical protein
LIKSELDMIERTQFIYIVGRVLPTIYVSNQSSPKPAPTKPNFIPIVGAGFTNYLRLKPIIS